MTYLLKILRVHFIVFCGLLQLSLYSQEAAKKNLETDKEKDVEKVNCLLYFYSCENGTNNFKALKDELDKYLATKGGMQFQPFKDHDSFNSYVKDKKGSLLLLTSWHYSKICKQYKLTPLKVGIVKGKKYQKKLLVVKDANATLDSISKARITAAGMTENSRRVLVEIFKDKQMAKQAKVLSVPKDLDALFSVGYGKEKAALITKSSFELLQKTHPLMAQKLTILAEGKESLNLILASTEGQTKDVAKALKVLDKMSQEETGRSKLKRLGLDGFKALDDKDRKNLEITKE